MTEDGEKILKFIKEIRRFSNDIALLLLTVDECMKNEGWIIATKTKLAYSDSSYSLDDADKWYPHYLFRFYRNQNYPSLLAFVSIILDDDYYKEFDEYLTEPIISAGFYDYGESEIEEPSKNWWYWYAQIFGYYSKLEENGIIYCTKDDWDYDFCDFQYFKCFGLPMTSISDGSKIESLIVNRLISLIPK